MKDWLGSECSFQCSKGVIAGLVPGPGMSLFGKVKEGASSVRVMGNKTLIEVCESQERLYILDCRGNRLVGYPSYLDWVHGKGSRFDYHSKVFNLRDIK